MLQSMRKFADLWVVKLLMALLVVSFGAWGIGDIFRGNPQTRAVAKVGDIAITVQALEQDFQKSMPEARKVFGPDLTVQQARQIGVLERSMNIMIEHGKFDQEAKRLGINVSDAATLAKIAAQKEFRDKEGKFNTQLWHRLLQQNGYTERNFIDEDKQDTARHLIFDAMINNSHPPELLINDLYAARGQKRLLNVVAIEDGAMKVSAQPDDKAQHEFYDKNGKMFTAPEYRTITIAKLSSDDIVKDMVISDEDLKKAYDARTEELSHPEQRDIIQVVVHDEAKAQELFKAASANHNLAAAAKAKGMNAVTLDHLDEKSVLPELFTTVFALDVNQIAEPVKSSLGWHVVQLKKITPAGKPSFDDVKVSLRDTVQRERSADAIARTTNKLDDELAAGHSLDDIAESMKLRLIKIAALDAFGKTPTGQEPDELPSKDEVLHAAFGQAAGESSQVIEDKSGNYLVVRTDEITPSAIKPFDTVKDQVLAAVLRNEQSKEAAVEAEKIVAAMRDGKKADSFAAQKGVTVRMSKLISTLGDTDDALPAAAMPQIFKMKQGDVIAVPDLGRHYVLRLADMIPVDVQNPDAVAKRKVIDPVTEQAHLELLDQYSKYLRTYFPVTINADLLDQMKKQGG